MRRLALAVALATVPACGPPGAVGSVQRVPDAYAALGILATHPRIDPDRIVLMGFSHGGLVATVAATDWARKHARAPEQKFRAILSFYPSCIGRVEQRPRIVVPLRVHTGEKDDWTPAAPCVESVERYRAEGGDVRITVYPDAPRAAELSGCVRRGATSGDHGPATEQARVNVRAQLAELLK